MHLACISLFHHPSGDHLDPSPDIANTYYVCSDWTMSEEEALNQLQDRLHDRSHYRQEVKFFEFERYSSFEVAMILKTIGLPVVN